MNFLIRFSTGVAIIVLSFATWCILVLHYADLQPEKVRSVDRIQVSDYGEWLDKRDFGINQLILRGPPFERGFASGQLSKEIMKAEEDELVSKFRQFIPSRNAQIAITILGTRWFWGIDKYFQPEYLEEMYGTSFAAAKEYNDLLAPFARQVAFHGLHEVGQMMVDQDQADMGCTVLAYPFQKKWVIGRNFDFEGGKHFDEDKIMKWVFPSEGLAFLSVTWAGMVGAVTGVNEAGVYASLNAAGSRDFMRYGTPTTLVLLDVLQHSKTAEEAVQLISSSQVFITDVFVVSDRSGKLFRIEKSPKETEVAEIYDPLVVANHLESERWKSDSINQFRKSELTSHYRWNSGKRILAEIKSPKSSNELQLQILAGLRDKRDAGGEKLHLGNRRAIDSLISPHSVVYNALTENIYVSQGPALSGKFLGFDLKKSFAEKKPVRTNDLPADPKVSTEIYGHVITAHRLANEARALIKKNQCDESAALLAPIPPQYRESHVVQEALGDQAKCMGATTVAKGYWQRALDLRPAYTKEEQRLREKLGLAK